MASVLTQSAALPSRSALEAAARADFVVVLYNPKSKKRDWQLAKAQEILLAHRDPATPVGAELAQPHPEP
jgi:precorrin-3B C17-methyltransferase